MKEWMKAINIPVVYTAGPFRAKNGDFKTANKEVKKNIQHAIDIAKYLTENGIMAMCPHANTNYDVDIKGGDEKMFLYGDLKLVMACDAILMLDRWWESEGAKLELSFAKVLGMPIYFETKAFVDHPDEDNKPDKVFIGKEGGYLRDVNDIMHFPYSMDELISDKEKFVKYPKQFLMFRILQAQGYLLHVAKNHDYSPMNMKGTGVVGAVTRLWDKTARLCNLTGFDLSNGSFSSPKKPKNESVDDTILDLANYSIITKILKDGYWGI